MLLELLDYSHAVCGIWCARVPICGTSLSTVDYMELPIHYQRKCYDFDGRNGSILEEQGPP